MYFKVVLVLVALCAAMDLSIALTLKEYIDFISDHNTQFDISVKISDTYEECCRMCTEIPSCKYWSYLYAAPLHNVCWLKTRLHGYTYRLGFLNGFKNPENCPAKSQNMISTPPPLTPFDLALDKNNIKFIKKYKINYEYDISVSMTETEENCCTICTETPGCNFWTYSNAPELLNVCWIKFKYQIYALPEFVNNLKSPEHCPARYQNMTSTPPTLTTTPLTPMEPAFNQNSIEFVRNYKIHPYSEISVSLMATIDGCCRKCNETPGCVFWTYSNAPDHLNVCWLKSRIYHITIPGYENGLKNLKNCAIKSQNMIPTPLTPMDPALNQKSVEFVRNYTIDEQFEISVSLTVTKYDCCRKCVETQGCVFWIYSNAPERLNVCWLKDTIIPKQFRGYVNGLKSAKYCPDKSQNMIPTPAFNQKSIDFVKNYTIDPNLEISVSLTATKYDCCINCVDTKDCVFWTYSNAPERLNVCWLKYRTVPIQFPGYSHGIHKLKYCQKLKNDSISDSTTLKRYTK